MAMSVLHGDDGRRATGICPFKAELPEAVAGPEARHYVLPRLQLLARRDPILCVLAQGLQVGKAGGVVAGFHKDVHGAGEKYVQVTALVPLFEQFVASLDRLPPCFSKEFKALVFVVKVLKEWDLKHALTWDPAPTQTTSIGSIPAYLRNIQEGVSNSSSNTTRNRKFSLPPLSHLSLLETPKSCQRFEIRKEYSFKVRYKLYREALNRIGIG